MRDFFSLILIHKKRWIIILIMVPLIYYPALLISLIIKFQNLPNYVEFYNWPENVIRIWQSTPSWQDALLIIREEWLFEIGYMNYDFGHGISEWSLVLPPTKLLIVIILGALIASYITLKDAQKSSSKKMIAGTCSSMGTSCVALSSVSLSWVVCCSTPTWVVGLSILGLNASTALWLEPLGAWLQWGGFIFLFFACLIMWRNLPRIQPKKNMSTLCET